MTLWFAPEDGWSFTAAKLQERPSLHGKWSLAPSWSWSLCHLQTFSTEVPSHRFSWPANARGGQLPGHFTPYVAGGWGKIFENKLFCWNCIIVSSPNQVKNPPLYGNASNRTFFGFSHAKKKWQVHVVFLERLEKLVPKSLPPPSRFVPPPPFATPGSIRINHPPGRPRDRYLCPVRIHQDMWNLHLPCQQSQVPLESLRNLMARNHGRFGGPNLMRENCWSASHLSEWKGGSGRWKGSIAFQSLLEE